MSTIIYQQTSGPSAFVDRGYGLQVVMNLGVPCVEWSFHIKELQEWLTTLEEKIATESSQGNKEALEGVYYSLKAAYVAHLRQHEAVVTEAPTADDLQSYLAAYAAAVGAQS
jgi:hypothetical protein